MVGVLGARIRLEEIHAVDALAEVLPEGLLARHEQHMAVTGLVHLIAHALPHAGQAGGAPLVVVGRVAGDLVLRAQVRPLGLDAIPVHVGGSIRLGELHLAPHPGLAGLDDAGEDAHRGDHRADVDADVRHVLGDAGEAVVVGDGLHDAGPGVVGDAVARHVSVGAGGAVPRQGGEHDRGIDLFEHVVAEPEARKCTGLLGLDDHVGGGDKFFVERLALLGFEVERDALLAAMGVEVQQGGSLDDRPGHLPDVITGRGLDLDDVGPEVGEEGGDMAGAKQT